MPCWTCMPTVSPATLFRLVMTVELSRRLPVAVETMPFTTNVPAPFFTRPAAKVRVSPVASAEPGFDSVSVVPAIPVIFVPAGRFGPVTTMPTAKPALLATLIELEKLTISPVVVATVGPVPFRRLLSVSVPAAALSVEKLNAPLTVAVPVPVIPKEAVPVPTMSPLRLTEPVGLRTRPAPSATLMALPAARAIGAVSVPALTAMLSALKAPFPAKVAVPPLTMRAPAVVREVAERAPAVWVTLVAERPPVSVVVPALAKAPVEVSVLAPKVPPVILKEAAETAPAEVMVPAVTRLPVAVRLPTVRAPLAELVRPPVMVSDLPVPTYVPAVMAVSPAVAFGAPVIVPAKVRAPS